MRQKRLPVTKLKSQFVRGFKNHQGCHPRLKSFLPTAGAEAPTVAISEPGKRIFGSRGAEIVPDHPAIRQKFIGDYAADRMDSNIFPSTLTRSISIKTRHRVHPTWAEVAPYNILCWPCHHD